MSYLGPQTPVLANVAGTNSSVTLFGGTARANGRMVFNDSSAILYVAYGTVATLGGPFTTAVGTQTTFTFPEPVYAGQVCGVWASIAGSARTTYW